MPRVSQIIGVEVSDQGNVDGNRTISLEIKVKPEFFLIPDMMVQAGALKSLEKELKTHARVLVMEHLESSKNLLESLGKKKRGGQTDA